MRMQPLLYSTSLIKQALKRLNVGIIELMFRVNELLEKASAGIIIALCGNKIDMQEERQVGFDVRLIFIIGS